MACGSEVLFDGGSDGWGGDSEEVYCIDGPVPATVT